MPVPTTLHIDTATASVIGVVVTTFGLLFGKYLDRRWKKQDEAAAAQKSSKYKLYPAIADAAQIKILLLELLGEFQACRISITQFHNGGEFYGGKGIQRMTITYEEPRRGVVGIQADVQAQIMSGNQLVWLEEVIGHKGVYYANTKVLPEGEIRDFYEYYNIISVLVRPLFDKQARMIGLLTLSCEKEDFLANKNLTAIRFNVPKLETLLIES